jgi:hypothetical protein
MARRKRPLLALHNHLRTIALLDNREKPLYAKRFRFKFIYHPGKIVKHARRQILRIAHQLAKEVQWIKTAWAATRGPALARAG